MLNIIKTAALSVAVTLGSIAAPVSAQAEGLYFRLGSGHDPLLETQYDDDDGYDEVDDYSSRRFRRHEYRPRHREEFRRHREYRRSHWRGCSRNDALNKAHRMGLRRVWVARAGERFVTVNGRVYGNFARITFARAPGCPVVG